MQGQLGLMNENINENREETAQDMKIVNSTIKKRVNFEMNGQNKNVFKIENDTVAVELKEVILNELQNATKCIDETWSDQSYDNLQINQKQIGGNQEIQHFMIKTDGIDNISDQDFKTLQKQNIQKIKKLIKNRVILNVQEVTAISKENLMLNHYNQGIEQQDLRKLKYIDKKEMFFDLISNGSQQNIIKLQQMIDEDPNSKLFQKADIRHILNSKNQFNQTPLYTAAKYGNLEVVQFLCMQGADPKIESRVSDKQTESLLEGAARWNQIKVFEYLMTDIKWTQSDIKRISQFKHTSPEIRKIIRKYSRDNFGCMFNFCLPI